MSIALSEIISGRYVATSRVADAFENVVDDGGRRVMSDREADFELQKTAAKVPGHRVTVGIFLV